ncbi:MAG: ribonuclease J, partial [Alphaproteobacteria bacterium]
MNRDDLLFVPIGGCDEIGMNLNLFHAVGRWLMVDCGINFAGEGLAGVDLLLPDPAFIAERRDALEALVLTHGHEDHIGAVAQLWPQLRCPIYATPFTAALVHGKLAEAGLSGEAEIREVPVAGSFETGPFKVRYVPLAHSIAEGHGLLIETPLGRIFHTGDWKLDHAPQIGAPSTPEALKAIGDAGVRAMIGDSTNVFNPRASGSEEAVRESLLDLLYMYSGRVVITTFASNLARLKTVAAVARAHDRTLCVAGRSLDRVIAAGRATGWLDDWPQTVAIEDAMALPRDKLLILCTGAQGEPRAALSRMARGENARLSLEPGDVVIFSAKIIPGNEISVARVVNQLARRDVDVVTERDAFVHVSGHP